jgi:hypothetical protein
MMKEDLERMKWDPRRTITRDFIVNEIVPNPVVQTATFIAYDLSNADLPGLPQEMPEMGFWVLMNDATEELEVRWWRGEGDPGHIDMPPTPREEGYTPVLWVHIHPPDSKRIWWQMSLADVNYVNNSEVWGMMVDEETWYVYGPHAGAWWPDEPARPPSPRTVDLDKLYDMWEDARLEQELP